MKHLRIFIILIVLFVGFGSIHAQSAKPAKIHMFGFGTTLTDSIVYFTEVQAIDGHRENKRPYFLLDRDEYALQFKRYLATLLPSSTATTVVIFADSQSAAIAKWNRLRSKYTTKTKRNYIIRDIDRNMFVFQPVPPTEASFMQRKVTSKK